MLLSDPLMLLHVDFFIKVLLLFLSQMSQLHHDLVSKNLVNLFEGQTFSLGHEIPHQRDVDACQNDEQEVVLPANLSERCGCSFKICNSGKEEDRESEGDAARANMARKDLRDVDEGVGVDATAVAVLVSVIDIDNRGESGTYNVMYRNKKKTPALSPAELSVPMYRAFIAVSKIRETRHPLKPITT
jgi:hypothetical protein